MAWSIPLALLRATKEANLAAVRQSGNKLRHYDGQPLRRLQELATSAWVDPVVARQQAPAPVLKIDIGPCVHHHQ